MVHSLSQTIDQQQDKIIDAFSTLGDDRIVMLDYLMDIGNALPCMDPLYKTDAHLVQGCMSKVWFKDIEIDGKLFFQADSNAAITKGLISLLVQVLTGQSIKNIAEAKLYFIEAIHMNALIGFQRANGLAHMIRDIKLKALSRLT